MNFHLILAFLFFAGSLIGWVIELFFRRFYIKLNPERKWVNPGFLVGPYLPIYGIGLCSLYSIAQVERFIPIDNIILKRIVLFVLMTAVMTAIEYVGGLIFIKHMNIKLWDYSEEWANLDGIICPKFSVFWAMLAALYYFVIHPIISDTLAWLAENLAFSFFIGMFFGVFIIDFAYSIQLSDKIRRFAKDNDIVVRYEEFKLHILTSTKKYQSLRVKFVKFCTPLRTQIPLTEHLRAYADKKLSEIKKLRK